MQIHVSLLILLAVVLQDFSQSRAEQPFFADGAVVLCEKMK